MTRNRYYYPAISVALLGTILTLTVYFSIDAWEDHKLRSGFTRRAREHTLKLRSVIDSQMLALEAIRSLYRASEKVERDEFKAAVRPFLSKIPGIEVLEWIPRVPEAGRAAYEAAAREDGFTGFYITEKGAGGALTPARRREEYFPVCFVEPYEGNEAAVGFDLASDSTRLTALDHSRKTGEAAATARVALAREEEESFGFLIFLPVYEKPAPADAVKGAGGLLGFVAGVFRIADIAEGAIKDETPSGVDIFLRDESSLPGERFLYYHPSPTRKNPRYRSYTRGEAIRQKRLRYMAELEVPGRRWSVTFAPAPFFFKAHKTRYAAAAAAAGFLITGLLTIYMLGHAKQTLQLSRINRDLKALIAGREEAQKRIAELAKFPSENPSPVLRIAPDGKVLYSNAAGLSLLNEWKTGPGETLPEKWPLLIAKALEIKRVMEEDTEAGGRTLALVIVPVEGAGYVNIYGRDVTEHKRSETALRAANQQLRANEERLRAEIAERERAQEKTKKNMRELEIFYKANVGREERILELKNKVKGLERQLSINRKSER